MDVGQVKAAQAYTLGLVRAILLAMQQSILTKRSVSAVELRDPQQKAGSPWQFPRTNNTGARRTGVSSIPRNPRSGLDKQRTSISCAPRSVRGHFGSSWLKFKFELRWKPV